MVGEESSPESTRYDDEPLESRANTHCVARPDAWPARAVHRRIELKSALYQEKVPGSLITGVGPITVPLSTPPSQQGVGLPHGSQPQGAVPHGSHGA